MRTIEEIRLDNFRVLVDELARDLRREPKNVEISAHLGVSPVYVHQLFKGKRANIQSEAARKIEEHMLKPRGWMDADHRTWPFPGIDLDRLQRLTYEQRMEIQGLLRDRVERFEGERGNVLRNGSTG